MKQSSIAVSLAFGLGLLAPLGASPLAQIAPVESEASAVPQEVAEVFANVANLEDIEVHASLGEVVGEVHGLVVDAAGMHYIVVEVGGFLGLGEDLIAVPMTNVSARGDASLALVGITGDQLEAMAEWNEDVPGFTVVDPPR